MHLGLERLDGAGPRPVGGDEGAGERLDVFRQSEDSARQRKLEAYEINGEQRRLFGGAHQRGDGQADGGHGRIDEQEKNDVFDELAAEGSEEVHEKRHP